ncbi:TraX family protein [Butyrivibrio sp. LC3010]|uniref:TraX family protein n=1 Tax=Butyrivibrio sp. LC3010 TaxID=1280680 RepID=UPI0003FAE29D|nr:TraX family protein [Butyrivibrio sp. LC3010]
MIKKIPDYMINFQVLSSDRLKIFAVITMFIDHIGAGILLFLVRSGYYPFGMDFDQSAALYQYIRHIGRWSFPIYCFFIVEGLIHTRNVKKYMLRLGLFGIISEPCFDLAFRLKEDVFSPNIPYVLARNAEYIMEKSNVYFTLLIGLIVIWIMKYVEDNLFIENPLSPLGKVPSKPLYLILYIAPVAAGAYLAKLMKTDYSYWGIILIAIFFVFRENRVLACIAGYIFFMNMSTEAWSLPAFTMLAFLYNGKSGRLRKRFKLAFYAFYPVHLLFVYLVRCYLYYIHYS